MHKHPRPTMAWLVATTIVVWALLFAPPVRAASLALLAVGLIRLPAAGAA